LVSSRKMREAPEGSCKSIVSPKEVHYLTGRGVFGGDKGGGAIVREAYRPGKQIPLVNTDAERFVMFQKTLSFTTRNQGWKKKGRLEDERGGEANSEKVHLTQVLLRRVGINSLG